MKTAIHTTKLLIDKAILNSEINYFLRELRRNGIKEATLKKENKDFEDEIKQRFKMIEELSNEYDDYCRENNLGEFSDEAQPYK